MSKKKGTQSCLLIGVGCLIAVAILAIVVGSLMFYGFRKARQLEETMKDPETRTSEALELLPTESLPEGYYAVAAFSVPFLMDTIVLADQEPTDDIESSLHAGTHRFVFTRTRLFGDQEEQLKLLLEGEIHRGEWENRAPVRFENDRFLVAGSAVEEGRTLRWAAHLGRSSGPVDEAIGLRSTIVVDCPEPRGRTRIGFWMGPAPDGVESETDIDLTGTVGDGERIQEFMRYLDVCAR